MARRFGSAMTSNTDSTPLIYAPAHIPVKVYNGPRSGSSRGVNVQAPLGLPWTLLRAQASRGILSQTGGAFGEQVTRPCLWRSGVTVHSGDNIRSPPLLAATNHFYS